MKIHFRTWPYLNILIIQAGTRRGEVLWEEGWGAVGQEGPQPPAMAPRHSSLPLWSARGSGSFCPWLHPSLSLSPHLLVFRFRTAWPCLGLLIGPFQLGLLSSPSWSLSFCVSVGQGPSPPPRSVRGAHSLQQSTCSVCQSLSGSHSLPPVLTPTFPLWVSHSLTVSSLLSVFLAVFSSPTPRLSPILHPPPLHLFAPHLGLSPPSPTKKKINK